MTGPGRSHDLPTLDRAEIEHVLRRAIAHDETNTDVLWENRGVADSRYALKLVAKSLGVPLSLETDALTFFSMGMSFGYELALERLFSAGLLSSLDFDAMKMDNGEDEARE